MARPENPHMGKLALPFMNSNTSLPLTNSSMRCCTSLITLLPNKTTLFHPWPLPAGAAQDARKIWAALNRQKPLVGEYVLHCLRLVKPVL